MTESVGELIAKLSDPADGEEAKYELIGRGATVVPELAAGLATLDRYGKLTAIEAFEALGDTRACPALIGLLADEDETVVEWSARALGDLRCPDSVEPLRRVRARLISEQVPPNWTGPVQLRATLTHLGARRPVVPPVTAALRRRRQDTDMWLFRSSDLPTVIDDLAEHSQVVLGFIPWRIADDGQLYGTRHELPDWSFDWSASWPDNVGAARHAARGNVAALRDAELLAHVEWIDESDVLLDVASAARRSEPHLPPDGYQQPAVAWLVEYSDPRDGSTCQAGAFASEAEARRLLERIEPDGTRCDVRLNIIVIHRTLEDWEWDR